MGTERYTERYCKQIENKSIAHAMKTVLEYIVKQM